MFKLLLVILFIVGVSTGAFFALTLKKTPVISVSPTPYPLPTINRQKKPNAKKLWTLVQDWRVKNNLKPYTEDQRLCAIAEDRVKDGDDFHQGLTDKYSNSPYYISENYSIGIHEVYFLEGWLKSPPHRKALETNYRYSCIRCLNKQCNQIFSNL